MSDTPLMKQYKEIKSQHEDSLLFFRLGDFYEMFFDDAIIASKELGLTLTARNREKGVEIPLAGVPYHTVNPYISKLVSKGYKVAVCEQTEDPQAGKGIVKREVVRIITPGTVVDVDTLDDKSNNYLMGIKITNNKIGISYIDITTGEFKVTEVEVDEHFNKLINEINKVEPREILINNNSSKLMIEKLKEYSNKNKISITEVDKIRESEKVLKDYFGVVSLESYGIDNNKLMIDVAAMVLNYAIEMQLDSDLTFEKIEVIGNEKYAEINSTTSNNLEIIKNQREKSVYGSLLWVLDKCKTSMGTRLLKQFINNPLLSKENIEDRQKKVQYFLENVLLREDIKDKLSEVYDLERLNGKIILGNENGKDLIALKTTLISSMELLSMLKDTDFFEGIDPNKIFDIYNLINESIKEDAPFSVREGGIIKKGYNSELDEIHNIMNTGKDYLMMIEKREKERTGIKNMKIKYNKVFGYFIEITKSNLDLVPDDYIRKQTLTNAERYITEELKKYEDTIINSKAKIVDLEYYLFKGISNKIKEDKSILSLLAKKIAFLDVIISYATVAVENDYVRPEITNEFSLEIIGGRHPVVEQLIKNTDFVSNDAKLTSEERFIVLTGPNMSGKSTYMKQIALICIMAQIGSYVPASSAKLSIVDKFLTRIGASDDILTGQSTFMVEMSEVSNILNNATENSLIILDEVGRGTSTFDGISIATAISEYIHEVIGAKTIFATHYHELTDLESKYKHMTNYRIEVEEKNGKIMFLRNIIKGGADKSYGIEVAKLAGLPKEVLHESKKILKKLESKKDFIEKTTNVRQLSLFDKEDDFDIFNEKVDTQDILINENDYNVSGHIEIPNYLLEIEKIIKEKNINNITPMEAMTLLYELKSKISEEMGDE